MPPFDLSFGAGRRDRTAAARFAACLRQEGSVPHLFCVFLYIQMRTDPQKLPEILIGR